MANTHVVQYILRKFQISDIVQSAPVTQPDLAPRTSHILPMKQPHTYFGFRAAAAL